MDKVYIVKKCEGMYEDYFEYPLGAFFTKNKAEEYKKELEEDEKKKSDAFFQREEEANAYYEEHEDDPDFDENKFNEMFPPDWYEEAWYKIEEVEVLEK